MTDESETWLALRVVEWIDEGRVVRVEHVFCPFRAESRGVARCAQCAAFGRLEDDDRALVCAREPKVPQADVQRLIEARSICSGQDSLAARTAVGEVSVTRLVCASSTASVAAVMAVMAPSVGYGALVVDDDRRPWGVVARGDVERAARAGATTLAECTIDPVLTAHEAVPLADALELLIHDRRRVLAIVDAGGRATGLVEDLEILHWFARAGRPSQPPPRH
jgi:CBS domain-containing protein